MIDKSSLFFMITIFAFGTVLLVFAMKYYAAGRFSRSETEREAQLKALAEKAERNQGEISAALKEIRADTRELATRVAAIETVLQEVE